MLQTTKYVLDVGVVFLEWISNGFYSALKSQQNQFQVPSTYMPAHVCDGSQRARFFSHVSFIVLALLIDIIQF